jgi:phosphatidylserine/phosphatidylglycerophosphate/cardiolipin synthase-like enzyme
VTAIKRAVLDSALESASQLTSLLDRELLAALAGLLAEHDFAQPNQEELVGAGVPNQDVSTVERELTQASTRDSRIALATALLARAGQERPPGIELCWTGPRSSVALRSTGPVIEQMIHSSERRITIAEFDVTEGALPILNMIGARASSGVEVCLLVDRAEEKRVLIDWATDSSGIEVWSSRVSPGDPIAKFHVKSVLVDGKVGMFGSANLTRHGLRGNVELGVLVRDPRIVQRAEEALMESRRDMVCVVPRR